MRSFGGSWKPRVRPGSTWRRWNWGDVIAGKASGPHTAPEQITICDLTGTGAQDTAIATHALAVAGAAGSRISI